jgi:hypothetical protein
MPIEIRELVIRATVRDDAGAAGAGDEVRGDEREALVAECIEQVMEILREEKER